MLLDGGFPKVVWKVSVSQGLNAFALLLDLQRDSRPPTQVTVARVNWERLCELFELRMPRAFLQVPPPCKRSHNDRQQRCRARAISFVFIFSLCCGG